LPDSAIAPADIRHSDDANSGTPGILFPKISTAQFKLEETFSPVLKGGSSRSLTNL
jgi:hypothetical protein